MFKLRYGYLLLGIILGLSLLVVFIWSLPDGKLHITFCNVGQGDAAYVRFPDGRDMLVDGGPNDNVLMCLGKQMPFWDRHINIVALSHPQKDHMQGLVSVLDRFSVDYFIRSNAESSTDGYQKLLDVIKKRKVPVRYMTAGQRITLGSTSLTLLWPTEMQIAHGSPGVLSASTDENLNDYSLVILLSYGTFETLFTGDADSQVEALYQAELLADKTIEVLKFPHHGSKTAVTDDFLRLVNPQASVISVGKNIYGHPSTESLKKLRDLGTAIYRTDELGDVSIVSDGKAWIVVKH